MRVLTLLSLPILKLSVHSLVPRPRPAFRRLQYGKTGRAWYLFSREHDVIGKLQKFAEQAAFRVFSIDYALNAQCVRQSPPASQGTCSKLPCTLALFAVLAQCAHAQSNPFYHPFYPDVTYVRKDTRPSPALPYCKRRKAGRGLGTRLISTPI